MKAETQFRTGRVDPFLARLSNAWFTSVQQVTILGTPDKLGVVRGRFVALEIKSEGKLPTKLQDYILTMITRAGGVALVVRPENWAKIQNVLTKLDSGEFTDADNVHWRYYA